MLTFIVTNRIYLKGDTLKSFHRATRLVQPEPIINNTTTTTTNQHPTVNHYLPSITHRSISILSPPPDPLTLLYVPLSLSSCSTHSLHGPRGSVILTPHLPQASPKTLIHHKVDSHRSLFSVLLPRQSSFNGQPEIYYCMPKTRLTFI